jgi:hypothetical protein
MDSSAAGVHAESVGGRGQRSGAPSARWTKHTPTISPPVKPSWGSQTARTSNSAEAWSGGSPERHCRGLLPQRLLVGVGGQPVEHRQLPGRLVLVRLSTLDKRLRQVVWLPVEAGAQVIGMLGRRIASGAVHRELVVVQPPVGGNAASHRTQEAPSAT